MVFEPVNRGRPDCRSSGLRPEPKAMLQRFEGITFKKKKKKNSGNEDKGRVSWDTFERSDVGRIVNEG